MSIPLISFLKISGLEVFLSLCSGLICLGSLYASVKDAEDMLRDIADEPLTVVKRIFDFERVNEAVEDSKFGGKIVVEFLKEE